MGGSRHIELSHEEQSIQIDNAVISLLPQGAEDYISLTDMTHSQMQEHIIFRWMSLKAL